MPPKTVLLMRHAEKPSDLLDPNLSDEGDKRAELLVDYIPKEFGKPDYIFAAADSKHSTRPFDTVAPLAQSTGAVLDANYDAEDYGPLAQKLLQNVKYSEKLVVICWHHQFIPDFAESLQAPTEFYSEKWKSSVFNQILRFDYIGEETTVTKITEPF